MSLIDIGTLSIVETHCIGQGWIWLAVTNVKQHLTNKLILLNLLSIYIVN